MRDHQTWLQLSIDDRRRAEKIVAALHELGCDEPQSWAESEISENIPQLARYRFLHTVWPQMIDSWRDGIDNIPAARRVVDSGAGADDVTQLARAVAYETVFAMLCHLEDGESAGALPGWALNEVGAAGHPTGRRLGTLHEDLLTLDPSGQDGQDLWT
ncbi:hypothetical protein [Actinoplanes friuliensis]|uniref:Uncharacterized protein n=1 Tax=Actinoplanes friuliensis DSM 7358 TaxID=1246995 RepID=U5VZ61_9ACTN|nr:hypothetical protein [Actinoplanes friuliensis]AGZ40971.1 hypothetical protein AFR_13425 [Actinoplanes friuliensis DSM 7358]